MNKTMIDFTKGIQSVNIVTYRSTPNVNMNDDMVKATIIFKKKENYALYNALRYDINTTKIKPCPHCKSTNIKIDNMGNIFYVMCGKCNCSTPDCKSTQESITKWNNL
jgi:predicted  nucleic acid-binding Zn ribbon protein